MKKLLVFWLTPVILFSTGCTGDILDILDQNTLNRVDDSNDTLATGIQIWPETRGTIEEPNETLANGLKASFDEETLARVDELLRVVEDGLKIGLDDETLANIGGMVDTIDAMPGNWEKTGLDNIQTLENTAGSTAKTLADRNQPEAWPVDLTCVRRSSVVEGTPLNQTRSGSGFPAIYA